MSNCIFFVNSFVNNGEKVITGPWNLEFCKEAMHELHLTNMLVDTQAQRPLIANLKVENYVTVPCSQCSIVRRVKPILDSDDLHIWI
jgi:hypothetical protein